MQRLVLSVFLAAACSKSSAPANDEPARSNQPAAPPVATTPPRAKPVKPPEPAAQTPSVNCDEIVTAADVEKHCKVKLEIVAGQHEGKMGKLGVCLRVMREVGKKFPIAQWKLAVYDTAADAQSNIKLDKLDGSKDIADLGDTAWTRIDENTKLKHTMTSVGVHKGRNILWIGHTKDSLNTKPPCTLDQLVAIAREATARL